MAPFAIFRAVFGYLFLVLLVRIVGRRPGKQIIPFGLVFIFYLCGLTLTGMFGEEVSLTNILCQIFAVALCHYLLTWVRLHCSRVAKLLDGVALILLEDTPCRTECYRSRETTLNPS